MDAHASVLRYEPFTQVRSVDPVARTAETEAGRLSYDVLSVIPPNKTMSFIADAGLGAPFVEVESKTFRSTRDERIYALGDNADTPFAKTAYTAMDSARVAAASIASALGIKPRAVGLPANVCYPLVAPDRALFIETHWALEQDATGNIHVRVSGRHDDRAKASYARLRRQWEARTLSTLFGP
jgi:NADPH-dependent 2,4-dienoyl-CoA reductase/sulfur reductase-like enzyme